MHTGKEALELLADPYAFEELGPLFIFQIPDARELADASESSREDFQNILLELPSVTCGIVTEQTQEDDQIASAADIILTTKDLVKSSPRVFSSDLAADLDLLQQNTTQNPIASMTLVQLLRLGQNLSIKDRLIAESLAYSTLQSGDEFKSWLKSYAKSRKGKKSKPQKNSSEPAVLLERSENLLKLTLNRPEKHNAYSAEMRDHLAAGFRTAVADSTITEIQLSAIGPSFSAGGDLDEFGTTPNPATAHYVRSVRSVGWLMHQLRDRIKVNVHGACVGAGIELPAFSKNVIAQPDAVFQLPEISLGLVPGAGGTASMPQRIGKQKTAWMALTGKKISAETALDWGLVDQVSS